MNKNSYSGKFVVFEGLDGSGQSTEAGLLKDFLIEKGEQVVLTKEPTQDSKAGKKIRQILDKKEKTSPEKLQELFTQDRKEHSENLIIPNLKEGKTVISDRYFFSSFAFGQADGLDLDYLIKINKDFLMPDLAFFLDVRPDICLKRIRKRGGKCTLFENKEKLEKVYQYYKNLTKRFKNINIINGEKSIKEVFSQIKKLFIPN